MEIRVEQLQHPTSPLHLQHRYLSSRYAFPETFLGAAKPFSHWCWTIPLIPAQLGNGSICGMRLWCRESNGRAHTSSLSPVLSTSRNNWIGPTGWWHNYLAAWTLPGHLKSCSYERKSNWGRLRSELALFKLAVTQEICQMRSAPAANQTRHVRSVTWARQLWPCRWHSPKKRPTKKDFGRLFFFYLTAVGSEVW